MHITVNLSMVAPHLQAPVAQQAEALGFDGVSLGDSIIYPKTSDTIYPYSTTGDRTFLEGKPFLDPLIAFASIAAVTERIRLQTSVLKLSVRHPVLVAKQAASVAVLSGDRLALGVGMSPWPEDFATLDVPLERRGRRFEEAISVVRDLLRGGYVAHDGSVYRFPAIRMDPVPAVKVPLLVGGHGPRNLARAAALADGWIGASPDLEALETMIATLQHERATAGLAWDGFECHAGTQQDRTAAHVRRLANLGVTAVAFRPVANGADDLGALTDGLRRLADDL